MPASASSMSALLPAAEGGSSRLSAADSILTQTAVAAGDEVAAFTAALATLPDLTNVLVTADALHCQRTPANFSPLAAGTTCSPSRATSRCCAKR